MIINQPGAEFFYENVCYKIGDRIVGTDASEYQGLLGSIIEIRDGEDKETENETPDIYCSFDDPVLPYDIAELEKRFSELYQRKKTIEDIALDEVIMAPEMIETIEQADKQLTKLDIYLVSEDWAVKGETGYSVIPFADYYTAKRILCEKLAEEQRTGCIPMWDGKEKFQIESSPSFYECWLDGEYLMNHYKIDLVHETLLLSPETVGLIGRCYMNQCRIEDFEAQIEEWDEVSSLTDEQYQRLCADPEIPERIQKALGRNDSYWESYWETVSEVAHIIVRKYLKENEVAEEQ